MRGQYGHSSPSTVMSHANRARPGLNGTGVYDRMSGIAIMSGDAGDCPIGPAAKPANPAPSPTNPSQFDIGTSFADGFACISTNWAKKNSIPSFSACFLTDSVVGIAIAETPCPGGAERQHSHERRRISTGTAGRRLCLENRRLCLMRAAWGRGGEGDRVAPRPSGTEDADESVR